MKKKLFIAIPLMLLASQADAQPFGPIGSIVEGTTEAVVGTGEAVVGAGEAVTQTAVNAPRRTGQVINPNQKHMGHHGSQQHDSGTHHNNMEHHENMKHHKNMKHDNMQHASSSCCSSNVHYSS